MASEEEVISWLDTPGFGGVESFQMGRVEVRCQFTREEGNVCKLNYERSVNFWKWNLLSWGRTESHEHGSLEVQGAITSLEANGSFF